VGLLRTIGGKPQAAIALVSADLANVRVRVAASGGIAPDAPPPKPLVKGDATLALFAALSTAQGSSAGGGGGDAAARKRTTPLLLARVGEGEAQTVAAMAQSADESLASDALAVPSGAIVAWDEDAPAG